MKSEQEARELLSSLDTYFAWKEREKPDSTPEFLTGVRAGIAFLLDEPQKCVAPSCHADHDKAFIEGVNMIKYIAEQARRLEKRSAQ